MSSLLKWKVQPAPTGPYRSFHPRNWPGAEFKDGRTAARIDCEDRYTPYAVKSGDHQPLWVYIADYSTNDGKWRWRKSKTSSATLAEAKALADILFGLYPHMLPVEYRPVVEGDSK